ncbi:SDR family NAD(P)-dependent oxidoreductase [Glutamicibacter sp.]|uniref:SDR family NAD(P)-dependent oxidoreductase n=1 Tax=Glutamicibacter sp. TaxID=1931995 RepID=UPI002FCA9188
MAYTVVTGGGRGLGAAIALRLATDRNLIIGYRQDEKSAQAVADKVRELGAICHVLQIDCANEESVARFFARVKDIGELEGLVNNAGSATAIGNLADNELTDIAADLNVNLLGPIACIKYALPLLQSHGGGAIVNISSVAAESGSPFTYVHYAAAKAGVEALTVGLSKELAKDGIRVNAVSPGTLWTEFHEDPQRPAQIAETIPMGRAGKPKEVAGGVAWLLSSEAAYTTGSVLKVSGGL